MQLKVFKFGGASVKDANAVRNVAGILRLYPDQPLIVVVSAMGKTTNALEKLVKAYFYQEGSVDDCLNATLRFHENILHELFPDTSNPVYLKFSKQVSKLKAVLDGPPGGNYDYEYDQIVCFGELFSSIILSHYLNDAELSNTWVDAREMIITDSTYREGKVDWDKTLKFINEGFGLFFNSPLFTPLVVTQGFISSTMEGETTTLGREGSDYTAAIFAYGIDAEEVIIWKDVPGLFNADPKYFKNTVLIDSISYKESLELSYYGAGVIHPNTIKPLQNKRIPLYVKSFNNPLSCGTLISEKENVTEVSIPCYIFKSGQWLVSISSRDFSYITEPALHEIFGVFSNLGIKINLMQNSAISFSVCIDDPGRKKDELLQALQHEFVIRYNEGLRLITVRNYTQQILDELADDMEILLEQKSRYTCQLVIKP